MARKAPVRDALYAEAMRRQRAASSKIGRLQSQGVAARGSSIDPRRSAADVKSMNPKQLRAHIARLNSFTDRKNQFVAGFQGAPIPRTLWRRYKAAEATYNAKAAQHESDVAGFKPPGTGRSIGTRITEENAKAYDRNYKGMLATMRRITRDPGNITGSEAVIEYTKDIERRSTDRYLKQQAKYQRQRLTDMFKQTGDADFIDRLKNLSDEVVALIADYTNIMRDARSRYNMEQRGELENKDRGLGAVGAGQRDNVGATLDWAATLPTDGKYREYDDTNVASIPTQFDKNNTNAGPINTIRKKR